MSPLVLNMASDKRCGGGVEQGAVAQEEDLFRRSNYYQTLNKHCLPKDTYPLPTSDDESGRSVVIYSPVVCVIKDSQYQNLKDPFYCSVVANAAVRNPRLTQDNQYKYEEDEKTMRVRIEMIYKTGLIFKHDSLVLGAFGCGVFKNPAEKVAMMFKECNQKYNRKFKKIGFAVLSDKSNTNYEIFNKVLNS